MFCTLCVKFQDLSDLAIRSIKKKRSRIIITNQANQQNVVLFRFKSQIDYKQQNKVRKINLFSNNKTLSVMLRMQDFALNI